MDDIMSGFFSRTMMEDWANDDKNLLTWRAATAETAFEKAVSTDAEISGLQIAEIARYPRPRVTLHRVRTKNH